MRRTCLSAGTNTKWSCFKATHEKRFFPPRSTSQEKWLNDMCLANRTSTFFESPTPFIVTAPRGYRKTSTAERVASRYRWYYNIKLFYGELGWEAFERQERFRAVAREVLSRVGAFAVVAAGLSFVAWYLNHGKSSPAQHAFTTVDDVASEPPSRSTLCTYLFVLLWFWSRRRIVIFDDLTKFQSSYMEAQCRLNKIKHYASVGPKVVVLSSNEGLPLCFSDSSSTTMVALKMPHATEAEFYAALQRVGWLPSKAVQANDGLDARPKALVKLTADELISFQGRLLEHHAFSARVFGELRNVDFGPLVANPKMKLARSHLWAICCGTDLECDVALAWADLGCSPQIKVAELGRVFDEAAMARINAALRDHLEVPRRLLLLAGLLATADFNDEFQHIISAAGQLRRLSPPPTNERASWTGYRNSRVVLNLMPLYMPQHHGPLRVLNTATSEICCVTPKGDEVQHLQEAIAEALTTCKLPDITDSNSNTPLHPGWERLRTKVTYRFHLK